MEIHKKMECFNCLGSINDLFTISDTKCFCSKPCIQAYHRPSAEKDAAYYQDTAKEMDHPTWKRYFQVQSLIVIGCLKHSKKEQLNKLKRCLQDTMVDVLELVEKKCVENDLLKMSESTKNTFQEMNDIIELFGS